MTNAALTASDIVDACLDRAEAALTSRTVADLRWAEAALTGCLDHAAKQTPGDELLVRNVLRTVTDELRVQLNG